MCVKNILLVEDEDITKFSSFYVEGSTYSINGEI